MLGKTEGKRRRGDEGWDGWMASPTQCPWVWANSWRWWRTGKPGVLQTMGLRRLGHDWATEQQQREREAETGISLRKLCQVCSTTIAKRHEVRSQEPQVKRGTATGPLWGLGMGALPGVGYSWWYLTHPQKRSTGESLVKGPTAAE